MDAPKITDWLQAAGAIVTAIASLILLWQLVLAKAQLASSHRWNKLNATFTYFSHETYNGLESEAAKALAPHKINLLTTTSAISPALATEIFDDPQKYPCLKAFLNLLEDYATAVNIGVFDEECAYSVMSGILVRYWRVLGPLIHEVRNKMGELYYPEVETLGKRWALRLDQERAKQLSSQSALPAFPGR